MMRDLIIMIWQDLLELLQLLEHMLSAAGKSTKWTLTMITFFGWYKYLCIIIIHTIHIHGVKVTPLPHNKGLDVSKSLPKPCMRSCARDLTSLAREKACRRWIVFICNATIHAWVIFVSKFLLPFFPDTLQTWCCWV